MCSKFIFHLPSYFEILHKARQHHCRPLCKISKWLEPWTYETSRDLGLMIWTGVLYWSCGPSWSMSWKTRKCIQRNCDLAIHTAQINTAHSRYQATCFLYMRYVFRQVSLSLCLFLWYHARIVINALARYVARQSTAMALSAPDNHITVLKMVENTTIFSCFS